ncbi:MAG: PEP-CTERM motif protein [Planctomycetes bacterium ADurb.Bin401]|nr:MAG: PEP-CTERM motif protein [Planctomycetes bacterium ADurb.Bin401]
MNEGRVIVRIPHFQPLRISLILLLTQLFLVSCACALQYWDEKDGSTDSFAWKNGGSETGLFGNPVVVGNTFKFNAAEFNAISENGGRSFLTDSLHLDLFALNGKKIQGIQITESGRYEVNGQGFVIANGMISLTNKNPYAKETSDIVIDKTLPITEGSGSWQGTAGVNDIAWSEIHVIITSNLIAVSKPGSDSFICLTELGTSNGIDIEIILIPEPATLTIFGLSGLVFFFSRKHTKNAILIFMVVGVYFIFIGNANADSIVVNGETDAFEWQNGSSQYGYINDFSFDQVKSTFIFHLEGFSTDSAKGDTIQFDLIAKPGYVITGIGIRQIGEYMLYGTGTIEVQNTFSVLDLDTNVTTPAATIITPDMSDTLEDYFIWQGSSDISGLNCSQVTISFSTQMSVSADDYSFAYIRQTDFDIPVTMQLIPEPATVAFLMLGSVLFVGRKFKK